MNQDALLNAYDRLTQIVGKNNSVFPGDAVFASYLIDETFLQGTAALVLKPQTREEIIEIISSLSRLRSDLPAEKEHLTLTLRGGGSGLSGACVPQGGIVLDLTLMKSVLNIDEKNSVLQAECGIILSEINLALSATGLYYAVDPSSAGLCTLGGSIATNAAGPSSLKYGTTRQNLATVTFVNAEGATIRAGNIPSKTSMGFSLTDLICGSEGRLGLILDAEIRLTPGAETAALLMAAFATEGEAMEFVAALNQKYLYPKCCEIIDGYSASLVNFPLVVSASGAVLMLEFDGTSEAVASDLERLQSMAPHINWVSARDDKSRDGLWAKRKAITHELKKRFAFKLGEDIAVPLTALAAVATFARTRAGERGVKTAIWGHAGDGNLHVNYLLEEKAALPVLDLLMLELAHEVTRVGGAISGEHGLGRLKKKFAQAVLPRAYFVAQENIKSAFDPECIFNPALNMP